MFHFKQFSIDDSLCAMKVGTDSVLLGAVADIEKAIKLLDIGCGTGILSLMAAQRNQHCTITTVEIDPEACLNARQNFRNSAWDNRITLYNQRFQDFAKRCETNFDNIICNPPYFSNSLKAKGEKRTMARHNDSLPLEQLLAGIEKILAPEGKFTVVLPSDIKQKWIIEAQIVGLYPKKITSITSFSHLPPQRVIIEFSNSHSHETINDCITIYAQKGIYSDVYRNISKDFYLNF